MRLISSLSCLCIAVLTFSGCGLAVRAGRDRQQYGPASGTDRTPGERGRTPGKGTHPPARTVPEHEKAPTSRKALAAREGLVLHFTFDTDEDGKATDSSKSHNDGVLQGAVYEKEGKSGGAIRFNGTRQAIVIKNAESLKMQDFTIMAWIKRGSVERVSNTWPQALIVGFGEAGYNMGIDQNGTFFVGKVGVNAVFSSCKITDDAFHHLAVTKNGSKIMFYLDGVAYAGADYGANFEFTTGLGIGARPDTLEASFLGLIDEVAVFNRVLAGEEVKEIYDSQK